MSISGAEQLDPDVDKVTGGIPDDPIAAMLHKQSMEAKPTLPREPVTLLTFPSGTFRFRTDPKYGRRKASIKLRVYRPMMDPDKDVIGLKRFEQWAARQHGDGNLRAAQKVLKIDEDVHKLTGEYYLKFRPLRGRFEGVYETKDPKVASYIRSRLSEFPFIYEEVRPMTVMVDGVEIEMIPANDDARRVMAAAAAKGL
jgi:hypothetical protein